MYAFSVFFLIRDWCCRRLRQPNIGAIIARPLVDWSKVHEDGKMKTIAHTDQAGLDRGLNRETRRAARKLHFQVECLCLTLAAI